MDRLWRHFLRFASWGFGVWGVGLTLITGWDLVTDLGFEQTTKSYIAMFYVFGLFSIALCFFSIRTWQTIRKERYANITAQIHQTMHCIRDFQTYIEERAPNSKNKAEIENHIETAKTFLTSSLDQIADIFRIVTSTNCRACIKLTYEKDSLIYLYTLTRDAGSLQKCRDIDNKRVAENADPLSKNPQFASLMTGDRGRWFFFCNNLAKMDGFQTTSRAAYAPGSSLGVRTPSVVERLVPTWDLPYKSAVTCAIRQGPFDHYSQRKIEVRGFLCVDGDSRGIFHEKWDVQLLYAFADALYIPIGKFIDLQDQASAIGADLSS